MTSNHASSLASLPTGVKIALASAVGVGLGYVAYRSLSSKNGKREKVATLVSESVTRNKDVASPITWRLKGRKVVVAGSYSAAVQSRVDFLLKSGAKVVVISPLAEVSADMQESISCGRVQHVDKKFSPDDVTMWGDGIDDVMGDDVIMLFYCGADVEEANKVALRCRQKRIPVNISGAPELCDFLVDLEPLSKIPASVPMEVRAPTAQVLAGNIPVSKPQPVTQQLAQQPQLSSITLGIFDGYTAAKYTGIGFSDVFFDFSFSEEGAQIEPSFSHHLINVYGQSVKVMCIDIRSGAGNALYGTVKPTTSSQSSPMTSHAFIPSSGLIEMVPVLHNLVRDNVPSVVHAAVAKIGNDLTIESVLDDIVAVENTGAVLIGSTSTEEVRDVALVSHLLAPLILKPVIHFFDGKTSARQAVTGRLFSPQQMLELTDKVNAAAPAAGSSRQGNDNNPSTTRFVSDCVTRAMEVSEGLLGKKYSIFEYYGPDDASIVLAVIGSSSRSVSDSVLSLNDLIAKSGSVDLPRFGVVLVRLLRPWDSESFVRALPASVRKLAVLGPIFSEVVASFHIVKGAFARRPDIFQIKNGEVDIKPNTVRSILSHLLLSTSKSGSITLPLTDPISEKIPTFSPSSDAVAGEVWDLNSDNTLLEIRQILSQSGLHASFHANVGIIAGETDEDPARRSRVSYLRISKSPLTALDSAALSDFAIVKDLGLLKVYNVFATLKSSASFVLQVPNLNTMADLEAKLPSAAKREIAGRRLKFFVVDPTRLGDDLRIGSHASMLAHSGLLEKLGGAETLPSLMSKVQYGSADKLFAALKAVQDFPALNIPREWLDAAENHELLPAPVPKLVVKSSQKKSSQIGKIDSVIKYLMFPEAYKTEEHLRPDIPGSHVVTVTVNKRMTPHDYERNVFHIEFDTAGTELKYELGEALGVHGHNDEQEVSEFLAYYGLNKDDVVSLPFKPGFVDVRTINQLFTQYLDIFGRPSKQFYSELAQYATDVKEKEKLLFLASPEGQEEFKQRVEETITYAEILMEFPSARPSVPDLLQLVPPIKPRHYSIASSMKMHPNSVHLCVVLVNWENKKKKKSRFGHCTRYLVALKPGQKVTVSVKPSVMMLPPSDMQPIIMAGLGTGMAPFRAFIQERAFLKSQGKEVGPIALYFGSRSRFAEYLYGEELEAYNKEGLLTMLRLAFSRDQPQKIYIQHHLEEDSTEMFELLVNQKGHFYLCGPTWPEADVKNALIQAFKKIGNKNKEEAEGMLEKLREEERYILELY